MRVLSRLARTLGHRRWFARMGKAIVPLDRAVAKLTKGRVIALGVMPTLVLTTVGRKSGQARNQPLVYVRDGENYVVIGSNWGQTSHPAWSGNLLANPDATITLGGREIPVRGVLARGAERERLFGLLLAVWPAYRTYSERAGDRELRVFSLIPR
ncbi:nitroreductase/quinone reductase family protein [Catellatospora tritici]|uniref:nitroreductase/quinone reductase family protein n=1 Tax=Catellatospora tritici TaxID=2851566 RepID=UPI001C2DE0EC|nr:nitroreductase/quinone reductase family protein [Catellatospora tritici]MBV1848596.1 nitroreductase family deazaflavin-dependent oxidoreductase [Catellatospora tritici]